MDTFQIENSKSNNSSNEQTVKTVKSGFFISYRIAVVIAISLVFIFTGAIVGTYFGKDCDSNLYTRCQEYACEYSYFLPIWTNECAARKTTTLPTTPAPPKINYRLPESLVPYHYDLMIQPFFKPETMPETYDATIEIHFACVKNADRLVFHMDDKFLTLDNTTLRLRSSTDSDFPELTRLSWMYDAETNFATIRISNTYFKEGHNYSFSVSFKGKILDNNVGFYRTYYWYSTGNDITYQRYAMASLTCFVEARKAFPCFDEPAFKAVFKIRIRHDSSMSAMSNMPVQETRELGISGGYDWIETEFYETVKMSTYLLAVLVSDFECKVGLANTPLSGGVNVSVCARPTAKDQLNLALNSSITAIEFFEEFYQIEYPLPKLDHVALGDFRFGAMENWGLVMYYENNLLYNDVTPGTNDVNVVSTVSHELSHMWFGNLVTPKWWDDLWLNEGFARFMEHLGADQIKPEWRMFDNLFDVILGVIQSDARETIRPIWLETNTVEDIDNNYDGTITYGKGSAVVKMLTYILGEDTFRNGIRSYFQKFKYSNVDQYDLWTSMYEQAVLEDKLKDVDIANVMTSWTKQKGHPVVTIKVVNNTHITIRQNRFVLDSIPYQYNQFALTDIQWYIPFSYSIETIGSTNSFTNQVSTYNLFDRIIWLNPAKEGEQEKTIELERALGVDDFLIGNLDMSGYYRVNYDEKTWRAIIQQINNFQTQLSKRTRAQIINDIFSFAQASIINNELIFELAKYLSNEFDFLAWKTFLTKIRYFTDVLESTAVHGHMQAFLAALVEPYYQKLGWIENIHTDDWNDRRHRPKIIEFSCNRDGLDCVARSRAYFDDWALDLNISKIPSALRTIAICTSIRHGSAKDFDFVYAEATKPFINPFQPSAEEISRKNDLLASLACSKEQWQLTKYLESQLDKDSNLVVAINNVATKPHGFNLAWQFLKNNWNEVYTRYSNSNILVTLLKNLAGKFRLEENLKDFTNFFEDKTLNKNVQDAVNESKTIIKSNINWYTIRGSQVSEWLTANVSPYKTK